MLNIDDLLKQMHEVGASDLILTAGTRPQFRINGLLEPMGDADLTPEDTAHLAASVLSEKQMALLEERRSLDFSRGYEGLARFRLNAFYQRGAMGLAVRLIPYKIPSFEELGLPDIVEEFAVKPHGLVLVTGPAGMGKSTTLAAMIDEMNRSMKGHIVTIEDPIEFVHTSKGCLMSQREIGVHTDSFAAALQSALREDPDVILVGEMRDLETISIAVTAAEMGILVMGTLHTNGAAQTVDRIINSFPADKQSHIRTMISTSLRGVVSQQLLPTCNRPGRAAALEIMVNTPAVANLIRQGKLDQLETAIQSGGRIGMKTMDNALMELVDRGEVSGHEAYQQANNKHMFEKVKDID